MLSVYDNFLPRDIHEELKEAMIGSNSILPWYYNDTVVDKYAKMIEGSSNYNFQFVHSFYKDNTIISAFYESLIVPFIKIICPIALIRIKANLNPITCTTVIHGWHIDFTKINGLKYDGSRHKTAVYYVNTNNGKTLFKDGKEVNSIANRFVVFNGNECHTGTTCTDEKVRCVINFNYVE